MPSTNNKKQLIIKYLKKLVDFLEKKWNYKPQIYNTTLHSLAPRVLEEEKELERIRPYLNSLKQAVDTPDINNVALTGGYGSGKSTILKTFQHLHKNDYDFLNISLASFDKKGKTDDIDLERKLEVSILQQMFYRVKPSRIPDSRFKRIINLSDLQLIAFSGGLLCWCLCTIILFKFDYINTLNPKLRKPDYTIDWVGALTSVIFFGGLSLFVKSIYRLLLNSKINKLTIKGELELAESVDNKSVFNQHLEEILYFFERTEYNVVVIEDLDRFDSTDIFTKLREINILINNSESINRTVKFVYAIKDEMFKDKNERVKFFEFIIPVISFINPTNAKEQLTKLIENEKLQKELSSDFTSDVVTFIDDIDMRLLINIFHEYQLYRIMLSNSLNQDKLFAIIVYKNLNPGDFGELQKRKGNLYDFFANKARYSEALTSELKNRIELIDTRILQIENEEEKSLEELRAVYINALLSRLSGFISFYVLNEYRSSVEVLEEKYFKALYESPVRYYQSNNTNITNSGIRLNVIENQVNSQFTYEEREQLLIDKHNNKINQLKVEKEKIKREIQEIEGYSIQELFTKINIENYAGAFKDNNLLRSLLINGYLDENYDDYISLFHEVNLTKNDFDFIRKIKSGSYLPFDYPLIRVENLLKDIQEKYFKRESILNYSLLSFLLKNEAKYEVKLGHFFGLLSIDGKNQFEFTKGYLKFEPTLEALFIKRLCSSKSNLWQYISEKSDEPSENVKQFLSLIFNHANKEDIYKLNSLKTLENYMSQMENFFQFCADLNHPSTVESFIKDRNIVFDRLDEPKISDFIQKTVFESIYQKNLYKINPNNIEKIVFGKTMTIEKTQLNIAHFTTIKSLNLKCLTDYIDANFQTYFHEILLILDNNTQEDEETLIHILNRKDVSDEGKEQFIQKQRNLISELASISSKEIKSILLKHSKIEINWKNIWDYYLTINTNEEVLNTELSLNETLIQYLNKRQVYSELSSQMLNIEEIDEIDESLYVNMSDNLIQCNDLGIQSYTSLLECSPYIYASMSFNTLDIDKLEAIIKKKKVTLTQSNISGLKEKGSDLHIRLLETYQLDLSSKLKTLELSSDDYIKLFKSSSVVSTVKLDVIQGLEDDFILEHKTLIREIAQHLPENGKVKMSFEVLSTIFKYLNSNDKKLAVLCNNLESLKNEEVETLILALGDSYEKIFQKKKRPTFSNSSNHLTLFENIGKRGLIKKYETFNNDKEIRVFALYD